MAEIKGIYAASVSILDDNLALNITLCGFSVNFGW